MKIATGDISQSMETVTDSLVEANHHTQRKIPRRTLANKVLRHLTKSLRSPLRQACRTTKGNCLVKPYVKVELLFEPSMEVELYRYLGFERIGYSICPKCGYALEREYQQYCEQCGQLLGWNRFSRGMVTVQRKIILRKENRNSVGTKCLRSLMCEQHFLRWRDWKNGRRTYYSIKKKGKTQPGTIGEAAQCECEHNRNV